MATENLVGYVGGLAVALGIGGAVWLGTPTASADSSSPSTTTAAAKPGRAPQRANAVASVKPGPHKKATTFTDAERAVAAQGPPLAATESISIELSGRPATGKSLRNTANRNQVGKRLVLDGRDVPMRTNGAAFGTTDPQSTAAAPATPNGLKIVYDQVADSTSVTVVDAATNNPVGSTAILDGSAGTPVLSSDGTRALITTTFHNPATDNVDAFAVVMNMTVGGQIGNTFGYSDASPMSSSFAPDGTHAVVTLFLASRIWVATLDTTTGAQTGLANLDGYPFVAPVWNVAGTRVLITLSQAGGTSTEVTVLDATTGEVAGTIPIQGFARSAPTVTADGTRALVTTTIHGADNWDSTRVSVIDTTSGSLAGSALTFPGTAKLSLLGDGRIAVITTSSGFVSILDTAAATASPALPLLPPWGLDEVWRTPLGAALTPFLFAAGLIGSAILAFYVLPVLFVIPAWIGEFVRQFPPITISTPW